MRTLITTLLITITYLILIIGCDEKNIATVKTETNRIVDSIARAPRYDIAVIDGCEYIVSFGHWGGEYIYSHKGNCKNPIHQTRVDTVYLDLETFPDHSKIR